MLTNLRFAGAVALTICTATAPSQAQVSGPAAQLPKELVQATPVSLMPSDPATTFKFTDTINTKDKPASFRAAGMLNGKPLFRADNPKGSINQYGTVVRWTNSKPLRKGDAVLITFSARALKARQESGEAEGLLFFQPVTRAGDERDVVQAFSVGPDWTAINTPFTASRDYAPGEAGINIAFSNLEQTIEFANLDVLNFETRLAASALPVTKFTYIGREPNAAWRKEALKRIEAIRTAPLTVRVVDANGKPVRGAKVNVTMTQPAFLWGSEVSAEQLVDKSPNGDRYREHVKSLFDTAVIGNGLKWPRWIQPRYRANSMQALDWLTAQNIRVKGHNLAWTAWKFSPPAIAKDPAARANIANLVEDHIRDITAATKGRLIGWDVVNEPIHEKDYFEHMPRERIAKWFNMARESDPSMKLTLNEYGMLNRSSSPMMIKDMLEFARMLKDNGAKVDILGVQGHVGQTPRAPASVISDLDLLAADGHEIQITEFDHNTKDEQLQGDYARDFLISIYSHPKVTGFIMWGFWQSMHWKPDAAMFRADWSPKPNFRAWQDLVVNRWKTKFSSVTPATGTVAGRGHFGRYKAVATFGNRTGEVEFDFTKEARPVVLRLNGTAAAK